jgi:hypothetical protein
VLRNIGNAAVYRETQESIRRLCMRFPLYEEMAA